VGAWNKTARGGSGTCMFAAEGGHLEVLVRARDPGAPSTAREPGARVQRWLSQGTRARRCCSGHGDDACAAAAEFGHLVS
jgi:hypothetical protein